MTKVHDFAGFMKNRSKRVNEQEFDDAASGSSAEYDEGVKFGANPEGDDLEDDDLDLEAEGEEGEEGEEEEVTLEDLKAMIEDLDARITALEPETEEEGEGEEGEEGEDEGEDDAEGDDDLTA